MPSTEACFNSDCQFDVFLKHFRQQLLENPGTDQYKDFRLDLKSCPFHLDATQKENWSAIERQSFQRLLEEYIVFQQQCHQAIDFSQVVFYGDVNFQDLKCNEDLYFDGAHFIGRDHHSEITFRQACFGGQRVSFMGCFFRKMVVNFEYASLEHSNVPLAPQQFLWNDCFVVDSHLNARYMCLNATDLDFSASTWLRSHMDFVNADFDSSTRLIFRHTRLLGASDPNDPSPATRRSKRDNSLEEYKVDLHYSDNGGNDVIGKVILHDLGDVHQRFIFSGRKFDRALEITGRCRFYKVPDFSHSDLHRLTRFPEGLFHEKNESAAEYYEALKKIAQDDLGSKHLWSELFVLEQRCYLQSPKKSLSARLEKLTARVYDCTSQFGTDSSRPVLALLLGPVLFFLMYLGLLYAVADCPSALCQSFSASSLQYSETAHKHPTPIIQTHEPALWQEAMNFTASQTVSPFGNVSLTRKNTLFFDLDIKTLSTPNQAATLQCELQLTRGDVQDLYELIGEQGKARAAFTEWLKALERLTSSSNNCEHLQQLIVDFHRLEHAIDPQYIEHFNDDGQYLVQILSVLQSLYNVVFFTVLVFTLQWRFRKSWDD